MNTTDFLEERDVRAIVRMLSETIAIRGANEQRTFLMRQLAELVGADCWVWGVSPLLEPGKQPVYLFHQTGGFDEARMARFLEAVEHPDTGEMTIPIILAMMESRSQVTRARQQIISDRRFLESPANASWSSANIGPLLISIRPLPGYGISVIGFYRNLGRELFSARETKIAHILLTEVPWLHEAGLPHAAATSAPKLPPRCRLLLNHLVRGRSRKEIAAEVGLSVETISGYVKIIFRHFSVHSQAELIAKFTKGDGRDG